MQALLALTLTLARKWLAAAAHLTLLAYMAHLWAAGAVRVAPTDAFRQLPRQKRQRLLQLGAHTALFMLVVYRLIEAAVHGLLTPEGRAAAQKLLREAAVSVHGY